MSLKAKLTDPNAYNGKVTSLLGTLPKGALKDSKTMSVNNTFEKGRYQDYVLDAAGSRSDNTGDIQFRTQSGPELDI